MNMQAVETDRKSNKSKSDTNSQRSQGDPADIEDTRLLDDKDNMQPPEWLLRKMIHLASIISQGIRSLDFAALLADILFYFAIVLGYIAISWSYRQSNMIERLLGTRLTDNKSLSVLTMSFSIYLCLFKLASWILKIKANKPTHPHSEECDSQPESPTFATRKKHKSHTLQQCSATIDQFIQNAIYISIILILITAYTYFHQQLRKGKPTMIGTKQIFYLVLWSMLAHSAYLIGLLLQHTGKVTNGCVLGKTMIVIIVFLLLGLAHGFDTFMFI